MPPKKTAKKPAKKVVKAEPAQAAAPQAGTRKRTRTAAAPAVASPGPVEVEVEAEAEVENSVVSVPSEGSTTILVEEQDNASSKSSATSRRKRQTTLTGDVVNTPEKPAKRTRTTTRKTDGAAAPAAPASATTQSVGDGESGGELKPSAVPKRSTAAAAKAKTTTAEWSSAAATPVLEDALLAELRNALLNYAVTRSQRTIKLTTTPSAAHQADALDAAEAAAEAEEGVEAPPDEVMPPSSDAEDDGDDGGASDGASDGSAAPASKSKHGAAAAAEDSDDALNPVSQEAATQALLCLPCVQHFILHECARVSRVVREEGGRGYGDDPAVRAMELLGLLLHDLDGPSHFATLLFLACPSCRAAGMGSENMTLVMEFLVLSQRARREDLASIDTAQTFRLLGLLDGCSDDGGAPVEPRQCCPYGEAHTALLLEVVGWANTQSCARSCHIQCDLVPYSYGPSPEIVKAAKQYYKSQEAYVTVLEREAMQQQFNRNAATRTTESKRRKRSTPPALSKATLQLLQNAPGGREWAEHLYNEVFPNMTPNTSGQPLSCSALQARIHAAYAYTRRDVIGRGGYFNMSLYTQSSHYRSQPTRTYAPESELIFLTYLFTFVKLFQHIAEATPQGGGHARVQRCLCHASAAPDSAAFLFVEEHQPHFAALRRCREELFLLVNETEEKAEAAFSSSQAGAYDVDGSDAVAEGDEQENAQHKEEPEEEQEQAAPLVGGDVSYYAAGSLARFYATFELTAPMNATQVVDYVARATADAADALPAAAVPAAYIHATLKRHQLEDVQWMYSKETEGYREHVQVPLYRIDLRGTAAQPRPRARRAGTLSYCATTKDLIVERGAAAVVQRPEWVTTGKCIRGGLLCDDVGLGKTLSILTLCAYDRAVQESGTAEAADRATAAAAPLNRFWQLSVRHAVSRNSSLFLRPGVLRWGCGDGTFHAGTAAYGSASVTRLPRTTLVVVPLSIAGQWIEELRKFYPRATYILFYGAKRTQYTVADLQRADFVLTTYETLSIHLRQETNGLQHWLARNADATDDRACAAAAERGWSAGHSPSQFRAALHAFATTTVWPLAPDSTEAQLEQCFRARAVHFTCENGEGGVLDAELPGFRSNRHGRGPQPTKTIGMLLEGARKAKKAKNAWKFQPTTGNSPSSQTGPHFACKAMTLYVTDVAPENSDTRGYQILSSDKYVSVSDAFLDSMWELMKSYVVVADAPLCGGSWGHLRNLFKTKDGGEGGESFLATFFLVEELYPMSDAMRRLFVRHVLLPTLWEPLQVYWQETKSHYAAVAQAESTGHMPIRILDLLFHRVVLDESQKCGTTSLFHLLLGERRWAVTGTPLNNNKTESLGAALEFIGMDSAAQILSRPPQRSFFLARNWIARHEDNHQNYLRYSFSRAMLRADRRLCARLHQPCQQPQQLNDAVCLCSACTQHRIYAIADGNDAALPFECRSRAAQMQLQVNLPCLPNTLLEVLALAMVRHERNDQVRRELQLPPVEYRVTQAALTAEETALYVPVAQVLMRVASRLHRQGLLTSRMGHAMQWVQELSRLCLHASLVGNQELLHGDVEAHLLVTVHFRDGDFIPDSTEFAASVAASFLEVTAEEALAWAQEEAANNAKRARGPSTYAAGPGAAGGEAAHAVPEETVSALHDLAADPPLLPLCGVCMDDMMAPTLLRCFHMFCKECLIGVIDASRSLAGNVTAKCPYCRDRKSLLDVKRVITLPVVDVPSSQPQPSVTVETSEETPSAPTASDVNATVARIGDGSRVRAFVELVRGIWAAEPGDGVLVFSKYPTFLQMAHDAIAAAGYAPYMVRGGSTLVQRQRIMRALQQPGGATPVPHRILFVTSRSANAGLNLTFANHVIFLEPNLNPAMEQQAVGRVHRFGQLKQVTIHHLYAPQTIEEIIYFRSVRLRNQAAQQHQPAQNGDAIPQVFQDPNEQQRRTQFGRVAPAEIALLLEYPVPPQRV